MDDIDQFTTVHDISLLNAFIRFSPESINEINTSPAAWRRASGAHEIGTYRNL